MNRRTHTLPALFAVGLVSTLAVAAWPAGATGSTVGGEEFDEFEVFIEINATDGDAGLQGMLDGDAWKRVRISGTDGQTVFDLRPQGALRAQGVTEFQWESDEPPFAEVPLAEFLARFEPGEYTARGMTIDGGWLVGETELTHDLPAGPSITSHQDGDQVELDADNVVVTWNAVVDDYRGGPLGSGIAAYVVTVEFEGTIGGVEVSEELNFELAPDTLSAGIPRDFLEPDREYKIEVGAIEQSGNRTFTEIAIHTVDQLP